MCKQGKYIKYGAIGSFKKVLIGKKSGFFSLIPQLAQYWNTGMLAEQSYNPKSVNNKA